MAETGESTLASTPPLAPAAPKTGRIFPFSRGAKIALLAGVILIILLAGALYLRQKAPPAAARLLPESDGIVFLDAGPLRAVAGANLRPVKHDPEYQQFIDATGIEFERDLNQAAFALHLMTNPLGPNGPVAFSSIFIGNFDHQRLASYLERIAQSRERYAGRDIYSIAIDGRTDRIAILGGNQVAVSNTPTPEQIHSILDRERTAILPFSGNSLLARHYRDVPLFSLGWGIGKLAAGLGDGLNVFGFRIPLSVDATFIASLRWTGALRLKVEEIAPNAPAATLSATSLQALLGIFQTAENALPSAFADPDTKTLLNSVQIEHHSDRAVLNATIPVGLLHKLTASPVSP